MSKYKFQISLFNVLIKYVLSCNFDKCIFTMPGEPGLNLEFLGSSMFMFQSSGWI